MTFKSKPQAVLSSGDNGYDIQSKEMNDKIFVCRNRVYHIKQDHVRMLGAKAEIKHFEFHFKDGQYKKPTVFWVVDIIGEIRCGIVLSAVFAKLSFFVIQGNQTG